MSYWYDETFAGICRFGVKVEKQVFSKQSEFQLVEIFDSTGFGRVLMIDMTMKNCVRSIGISSG